MNVWIAVLALLAAMPSQVHVSPSGDDAAAGSVSQPVATVAQAVRLIDAQVGPGEIIIHQGVYNENVTIAAKDNAPPLIITAHGAVFDHGHTVHNAEPVHDMPGVFRVAIPDTFDNYTSRRSMWEADTRTRYRQMADARSVAAFPASFRFQTESFESSKGYLYFHTSDGQPPATHDIGYNIGDSGFNIHRDNVTLRGLTSRNGGGIGINGANAVIEDCAAWNIERMAIYIGAGCTSATVRRFTATDVGAGIYSEAGHTLIENCRLFRGNDDFESHAETQLDSAGIQVYHPGRSALIRGNLVVGFPIGIFCKGNQDGITAEHNTCVGTGTTGGSGMTFVTWKPGSIMRGNIVAGYHRAYWVGGFTNRSRDCIFRDNLLWDVTLKENIIDCFTIPQQYASGQGIIMADPRFAAPGDGDYHLLADSPALRVGGVTLGALPRVADGWQDTRPPTLALTAAEPATRLSQQVETFFESDHWNPGGGVREARGTTSETEDGNQWLIPDAKMTLALASTDNASHPAQMKLRIGDGDWSEAQPFAWTATVALHADSVDTTIAATVADEAGNWSKPATLRAFRTTEAPALVSVPTVYVTRNGFIVTFKTDMPCNAVMQWGATTDYGRTATRPADVLQRWNANDGGEWTEKRTGPRRDHHLFVLAPDVRAGETVHYRLALDSGVGHVRHTNDATVVIEGDPRTIVLDPNGTDVEGTQTQPWRTLQFAVDRALPGDRIVLRDGVYTEPVTLLHGGIEGAPLVIEAEHTRRVALDVGKRHPRVIQMHDVSWVTLRGFEIRWFNGCGIQFTQSPNITLENLTIWNTHLTKGRRTGTGFYARRSPDLTVRGCALHNLNEGFALVDAPRFHMENNTATRMFHRGCRILFSTRDSVFINNSFTFTGSDHFQMYERRDDFATFVCDYNNFAALVRDATYARNADLQRPDDEITRWPGSFWASDAKGVNSVSFIKPQGGWEKTYSYTFAQWQASSGKDAHSIYKRPLYADPFTGDWRLQPQSPNVGAGKDGATIGAFGIVKEVSHGE